ncbi:MAG: CHAT domain-containing protein, partial [Bacteroidota bacterium]
STVNTQPNDSTLAIRNSQSTGYDLYQILLGDIEDQLEDQLIIIGDGPLVSFPFQALPTTEEGGGFLGLERKITTNVSLRMQQLMESVEIDPKREQLLGFAPTFNGPLEIAQRGAMTDLEVSALQNNQDELTAISTMFPGQKHLGYSATRENFFQSAEDYSVLHLATHAKANIKNGRISYLVLVDEEAQPEPLYAAELANLSLNAEMVVLSACETASGSSHHVEGTIGLTRSFAAAGARSIISSLWPVDDAATAEIMTDLYRGLDNGLEKDAALQMAQAAYRERHEGTEKAHPYYWAAFNLIGSNEAIALLPSWRYQWYWLALGLLGLLVITRFFFKGRR